MNPAKYQSVDPAKVVLGINDQESDFAPALIPVIAGGISALGIGSGKRKKAKAEAEAQRKLAEAEAQAKITEAQNKAPKPTANNKVLSYIAYALITIALIVFIIKKLKK